MRTSLRSALVVSAMALSLLVLPATAEPASANAPMTTTPLPAITTGTPPAGVLAHGNGNFTAISQDCPSYKNSTDTTAISAITHDGGVANSIKKLSGDYQTQPCVDWMVAGADSTTYAVQVGSAPSYNYRLVAARDNMLLWAQDYKDPTCGNRKAYIKSPRLGKDGNIYALLYYPHLSSSCPAKQALAGIDASTGFELWRSAYLPVADANSISVATGHVLIHDTGVAVRSGLGIYFYDYNGAALTSETFTVPGPSGATMPNMTVVQSTGRVFATTMRYLGGSSYEYHLYYKDLGSSTVNEITGLSGPIGEPMATPGNGVAVMTGSNLNYFGSTGTLVYSQNLHSEPGTIYQGIGFGVTVDNLGNVIARRTFDQYGSGSDRNAIIDQYSPTGVKTRLFHSSSLGGTGFDSFVSLSPMRFNIGGGKLFFVLCHRTNTYSSTCYPSENAVVVQLTVDATSDYTRYAAFNAQVGGTNLDYVALGDSFSSGEGIPASSAPYFIPPSDSNNCNRSYQAYPLKLQSQSPGLRLRAFRACSGAEIADVSAGMNGEPGQLDAIRADTDVITITIGGNDVDFEDFAAACVTLGCEVDGSAYNSIMSKINDPVFSASLENLYVLIRQHATNPNVKIYVVGYPRLAAAPYPSCSLTAGDLQAAELVGYALNIKIRDAVDAVKALDPGFTGLEYVDPTATGSPFLGHELCTSNSYFNGFNFWEHRFSFHPNALGQQAYAELISQNM